MSTSTTQHLQVLNCVNEDVTCTTQHLQVLNSVHEDVDMHHSVFTSP